MKPDIKDIQQRIKNFNWRSLKKYAKPSAADDFNAFLEKLPQHAGKTMLILAGVAWGAAGIIGLYTTIQMKSLTELRAEWEEAEALKPLVPEIKDVAVNATEVQQFVEQIKNIYTGLEIKSSGPTITISSTGTGAFGQFREAIGHVQNGGSGWRVNIDKFCVGRECKGAQLFASLKINKVSVN